jgi:branched-chain amino acid transport system substrate-binding protein
LALPAASSAAIGLRAVVKPRSCGAWRRRSGIALALLVAATGCSATTVDRDNCEINADCASRFGFGWICGDGGFCEESTRIPRCASTFPEDLFFNPEEHTDTIVFGNIMDRSLGTHRAREKSVRLALKQANDEGGLQLRKFGVVFCTVEEDPEFDNLSRPEAAVEVATYLVETLGVPAVIGPAASDDVNVVFMEINGRGHDTLFISPSATSPALTDLDPATVDDDNPGLLWRTAPPDSLQGAAIAYDMRVARDPAVDDVAVIYQSGAYGEALSQVFDQEFKAAGGPAPSLFSYDNDGVRAEAIGQVAQGSFDEVLFVSSQTREVIEFMNSAAELTGFDPPLGIFLTDAAANPDLVMEADPTRFPQVRGTRQAPRNEDVDLVFAAFIAAYAGEYGEDVRPFSFTANSYDAAWLLVYGSAWSLLHDSVIDGPGIGKGLRRLSDGPKIEIRPTTWNQVRERFSRGESVDIEGASGSLDYDPMTEETTGKIETWRINAQNEIEGIEVWPPEE